VLSGAICTLTPAGAAIGARPMRDMLPSPYQT
jgi:hypothetical protein